VSEEFHVNRWFDHQREDGVIEREIFPAGILFQVHQTVYKVRITLSCAAAGAHTRFAPALDHHNFLPLLFHAYIARVIS
jgi:hypothetical protein